MADIRTFTDDNKDQIEALFGKIETSRDEIIARIREIAEIPSPTFHEDERSDYVRTAFVGAGLRDVHRLTDGSVLGFTLSREDRNTLLLAAHIDTVFPVETDLTTRIEGSTLFGPGTGDNSANVAALIRLAEITSDLGIRPKRNIAFCGTVREEGRGNLGGMAEVLKAYEGYIGAVIAVDGRMTSVTHRSQEIRRYVLKARGPGGHSWNQFGTPSAVQELAKVITAITAMKVPAAPKTTFNVGTVSGGTSVNAIAQECTAEIDLRSLDPEVLRGLEQQMLRLVSETPAAGVRVEAELVATRHAGEQPPESDLVRTALDAADYLGIDVDLVASSTDAALSLSRGIPSISFGTYRGGGVHTLGEQVDLDSLTTGLKWLALVVLALASS